MDNTGFVGKVTSWWAHPFNTQGSVLNWIAFVWIMIIAVMLWQLVMIEVTREV